jgi:hypothetical protein
VQKGDFQPPRLLREELPWTVDEWMRQALSRDLEARFGSAMAMSEALSAAFQRNIVVPVDPEAATTPENAYLDKDGMILREQIMSLDGQSALGYLRLEEWFSTGQAQSMNLSIILFEFWPRRDLAKHNVSLPAAMVAAWHALGRVEHGGFLAFTESDACGVALVVPVDLAEARARAKMLDPWVREAIDEQNLTQQFASIYVGVASVEPPDKSERDLLKRAARAREGIS